MADDVLAPDEDGGGAGDDVDPEAVALLGDVTSVMDTPLLVRADVLPVQVVGGTAVVGPHKEGRRVVLQVSENGTTFIQ